MHVAEGRVSFAAKRTFATAIGGLFRHNLTTSRAESIAPDVRPTFLRVTEVAHGCRAATHEVWVDVITVRAFKVWVDLIMVRAWMLCSNAYGLGALNMVGTWMLCGERWGRTGR